MARRFLFELQVHADDIRRGVRYLFVTRRHVTIVGAVLLLWVGALGWAATALPQVVRDLRSEHEYDAQWLQRRQQGERLKSLLERLQALDTQAEALRTRMAKVHLAYGLPEESNGQGGFPVPVAQPPASIYAEIVLNGNRMQAEIAQEVGVLDAFLREVQDFETHNVDQVHTTPSTCPLKGYDFVLTSPFGTRSNPFTKQIDFHAGIDLAAPEGTEVHAPAEGVVVFAGRYDLRRSVGWWRYGNLVVLRHGDRFVTLFGHLSQIAVKAGQRVRQGDVIALVGNTGWSTSSHLHYEVRRSFDGEYRPVDPRIYILDHRWRDEERLLVAARSAPDPKDYEPLPARLGQ